MQEKFSQEQIHEFWTQQALKHGRSSEASWSDQMAIEMEIKEISARIQEGDRILDIGCANGYSTLQFVSQKKVFIKGIDLIPEMITQARLRSRDFKGHLLGEAEFHVGDIASLQEKDGEYDKVIVTRVLINQREWDSQLKGVNECIRVVKKGGIILFSEATIQGWQQLNKFRKEWGLSDIPMPAFNSYIDQDRLIESVSSYLKLVELINFSSTYYVCTRILKPLLIKALRADIDAANPRMEWNRWFAQLPAWGDYGTQKLFVFQKK